MKIHIIQLRPWVNRLIDMVPSRKLSSLGKTMVLGQHCKKHAKISSDQMIIYKTDLAAAVWYERQKDENLDEIQSIDPTNLKEDENKIKIENNIDKEKEKVKENGNKIKKNKLKKKKKYKTIDGEVEKSLLYNEVVLLMKGIQELSEDDVETSLIYMVEEEQITPTIEVDKYWKGKLPAIWRHYTDVKLNTDNGRIIMTFPTSFEATVAYVMLSIMSNDRLIQKEIPPTRFVKRKKLNLFFRQFSFKAKLLWLFCIFVAFLIIYHRIIQKRMQYEIFKRRIKDTINKYHSQKKNITMYPFQSHTKTYQELKQMIQTSSGAILMLEGPKGSGKGLIIKKYITDHNTNFIKINCKKLINKEHMTEAIEKQLGFDEQFLWSIRKVLIFAGKILGSHANETMKLIMDMTGVASVSGDEMQDINVHVSQLKQVLSQISKVMRELPPGECEDEEDQCHAIVPMIYVSNFDFLLQNCANTNEKGYALNSAMVNAFMEWLIDSVRRDHFNVVIHGEGKHPISSTLFSQRMYMLKRLYLLDPDVREGRSFIADWVKNYCENVKFSDLSKYQVEQNDVVDEEYDQVDEEFDPPANINMDQWVKFQSEEGQNYLDYIVKFMGTRPGDLLHAIRYHSFYNFKNMFDSSLQHRLRTIQESLMQFNNTLKPDEQRQFYQVLSAVSNLPKSCETFSYYFDENYQLKDNQTTISLQEMHYNILKGNIDLLNRIVEAGFIRIIPSSPKHRRSFILPYSKFHHGSFIRFVSRSPYSVKDMPSSVEVKTSNHTERVEEPRDFWSYVSSLIWG